MSGFVEPEGLERPVFDPEGLNTFLGALYRDSGDLRSGVDHDRLVDFERDPSTFILDRLQLTPVQRRLLAATSDDELYDNLRPLFAALRDGKTVRVDQIITSSEAAIAEAGDESSAEQAAPNKIVITIGRGRCKIVITIDL